MNPISQDLNFNSNGIIKSPHPVASLSCMSDSTKEVLFNQVFSRKNNSTFTNVCPFVCPSVSQSQL